MADLTTRVERVSAERGKVASRSTLNSITTTTSVYSMGMNGRMEANDNWRFVGNGRGPGRMPPVANIQSWLDTKGLTISAWVVARKIGREGSKDFRQGNANVFEQAIDEWQFGPALLNATNAAADAVSDTIITDITRQWRR